jgi:hypothetical protein
LKPDFESKIKSNRNAAQFVKNEIEMYFPLQDALETIAACYKDKYDQQQQLIATNPQYYTPTYLGSYLLKSPYEENIPTNIRTRGGEVIQAIESLVAVLEQGQKAETDLTDAYNAILNATDSRTISGLQTKYNEAANKILDEGQWNARDAKNKSDFTGGELIISSSQNQADNFQIQSLVAKLAREVDSLTKSTAISTNAEFPGGVIDNSPLGICRSLKIEPPTNVDNAFGGGGY